jgi:hypothetical protein
MNPAAPEIFPARETGDSLLHSRDDFREARGIVNRDFGKHFPIQGDVRLRRSFNESAIADSIESASRGNSGDPKRAILAFLKPAVRGAVRHRVLYGLVRLPERFASGSAKSLGPFENALSTSP